MIKFSVKLDIATLKKGLDAQHRQVLKAASYSINRAIDGVRTAAARDIADQTKLKVTDVKKRMYVKRANPDFLITELTAYPLTPNLSKFKATLNKTGTAASAWERRKTYRHAFKLPSGTVVTRTTNKRFPLKGLRGPSLTRTFMKERTVKAMMRVAEQRWRSTFQRDLARRLAASL